MTTDAPTQNLPSVGSECPNCGAHADPGQLVCLECGARLALDYRRPRGWSPALAVIAAVLLVGAAAFVITLNSVDDDAKEKVAATKAGRATPATPRKNAKGKQPQSTTTTTGG